MSASTIPQIPTFPDPWEASRAEVTRKRRRMIDGGWEQDLQQRMLAHFGHIRSGVMGPLDLSANPYKVVCQELSTLYLSPPMVRHDLAAPAMTDDRSAVTRSGLWAQARRYQTWVIGCRDYAVRASATESGELRYRPVAPDLVVASSTAEIPDVPVAVSELRLRRHPNTGRPVWTWDRLDVSDLDAPIYEIREWDSNGDEGMYGLDWSGHFGPITEYPYRTKASLPVLPYVIHHASRVGDRLWDAWHSTELYEGSLNLAAMMTFALHSHKDASWPQRWAIGAQPAGMETVDKDAKARRQEVVTDPGNLLMFEPTAEGVQPQVGQFEPGADTRMLYEVNEMYSARLGLDQGISGSDMQRMSGDPRSGYAISLSNNGKREAQRTYVTSFRDGDERLMALSAILLNCATGSDLPESDYSVIYREIPLSPEEIKGREESALRRRDAGLLSRVDAYRELNPGLSAEQAQVDLDAIDAEATKAEKAEKADDPPEPDAEPDDQENDDAG